MDDRYSRLKSLSDFGLDVDFNLLSSKSVLIVGVGGVGSITAEMLARCGLGTLALIDFDTVERVNLNRLLYTEAHIGRPKVDVMREYLNVINSDVSVEAFHTDLCSEDFENELHRLLSSYDLAISCLDNLPARLYLNSKCVEYNLPYVDTGATRSGLGGYVHLVIPFKTACYVCTGSMELSERKKGLDCTASLPSTIAIIASLATEITLKYLLNFGKIPDYISFNALTDQYIITRMRRDPNCYVCGEKRITEEEQKASLEEIKDITDNKQLHQLIDDLSKLGDEN